MHWLLAPFSDRDLYRRALRADTRQVEQAQSRWRPLGEVLVEGGQITRADLEAALAEQGRTRRRLGEILIESGRLSWLALAQAIAEQSGDLDLAGHAGDAGGGPPGPAEAADTAPAPPATEPPLIESAPDRLQQVEALLRDRQRAFLELVSTAEQLRRRVDQLERELAAKQAELQQRTTASV